LGNFSRKFKYRKRYFGRCGTQTAGLAFGGDTPTQLQQIQKNTMELLGQQVRKFKYCKMRI
jgi:hypothetical protein